MSINLDTGLWRCFKSGETGNFIRLYSILEQCSYRKAYEEFIFGRFLNDDLEPEEKPEVAHNIDEIELEPFDDCEFVRNRMLDSFKFYKTNSPGYKDRLIIPFTNLKGKIFYYQARALEGQNPKYLNCKSLKTNMILYPFDYESTKDLYVTEGVFDALSLRLLGFNTTSTLSCVVSPQQMTQLSQYQGRVVCAFDSDEAGKKGVRKFLRESRKAKMQSVYKVDLPDNFKDWNEVLVAKGPDYALSMASLVEPLDELRLAVSGL